MALASSLLLGARMGLSYNPLVALLAAPLVAALAARSTREHSLLGFPGLVLLAAWLAGDGLRVVSFAAGVAGERSWQLASLPAAPLAGALAWALVAFAVGYALPAWAGAFVGRRVTHGTGWASAAAIALVASGALAAVLGVALR